MEKYLENYQTWLESDKITDEEKAELQSIANDENESEGINSFITNAVYDNNLILNIQCDFGLSKIKHDEGRSLRLNFEKGYIIKVKYKLMKSYCVNYDYENDKAIIKFNKGNRSNIEKIRIFYETDKESSIRKLENINLNPIYNASYNGYIYICDYTLEPSKISIYPSSTFLYANGKDEITVLISIKDKYDNPIENAKANVICQYGSIEKLSDVSDCNGIIPCIYRSATIDCIDSIKAIASVNVKDTVEIINRKL